MQKVFLLFLLILGITPSAFGEYRVYKYYVRNKNTFIQDNPSYIITSNLPPRAYVSYHGGYSNVEVDLVRTWMCPGHTGDRKEYCDSPYKQLRKILEDQNKNVLNNTTKEVIRGDQ